MLRDGITGSPIMSMEVDKVRQQSVSGRSIVSGYPASVGAASLCSAGNRSVPSVSYSPSAAAARRPISPQPSTSSSYTPPLVGAYAANPSQSLPARLRPTPAPIPAHSHLLAGQLPSASSAARYHSSMDGPLSPSPRPGTCSWLEGAASSLQSWSQPPLSPQGQLRGGEQQRQSRADGDFGAVPGSPVPGAGAFAGLGGTAGLGTWGELIAGGVVDKKYIEEEADRRKKEIDRAMDKQLADIENECQQQRVTIEQQAEYHTQMAEKQIETHKRQHQAHLQRQAEIQAHAILQRADAEKSRLGHEAAKALAQQSEREKATVQYEAMRSAEEMWRQSQRALLEQAQKHKVEIEMQAKQRTEDIEHQVREAMSRVYISSQTASPLGQRLGLALR
eukprot:TRINITY_DN73520_c0_g1_i1.p1 TRINITY_DN73520_c0_g1~~TRINITY_DN73520_c0_g1_i1.p1  ORF type:complete len:391 (+),score=60.49 TRINITY_DN73520_c0_g1_i1:67-1239(+)